MKKFLSILLVAMMSVSVLAGCSAGSSTGGSKDKVYTLKMSTQLNEGSPFVEGFMDL